METENRKTDATPVVSRWKRQGQTIFDLLMYFLLFFFFFFLLQLPLSLLTMFSGEEPMADPADFVVEAGVTVAMLIAVVGAAWVMLWLRGKPFSALGLSVRGHGREGVAGGVLAVLLYAVGFLFCLLAGVVEVAGVSFSPAMLGRYLLLYLLVAVTEEVMVRGFVLGRLLDGGVHRFTALLLSSLIFSLMHAANPNFALLPLVNIALAGLLLGASYIYTRNLCLPIILHWFWNWLQGPVLGYAVSGTHSDGDSLLTLRFSGSELLGGGDFGFEGSLCCTVLLLVGTIAVIRHYEKRLPSRHIPDKSPSIHS